MVISSVTDTENTLSVHRLERSFDVDLLSGVLNKYPDIVGEAFNPHEWLDNDNNVALVSDDNFGLFEFEYPGVYTGHYFFGTARGKEAFELSRKMLNEIFVNHGAQAIRGLVPMNKRGSAFMTRKLGFTSHDVLETTVGPCELFVMTLDEFYSKR